jgi:hypothetical protein
MTKTLNNEDWNKIKNSFNKRDELDPDYTRNLDLADEYVGYKYPRTYISIEGIEEQIEMLEVGESIFYMDYFTPDNKPQLSGCKIISGL